MQRLELVDCSDGLHMVDQDNGYWVRYEDAQAEIARLSVALADTQAKLAGAYEAAAQRCDLMASADLDKGPLMRSAERCARAVRALSDPEATTALTRVKAQVYRDAAVIAHTELWPLNRQSDWTEYAHNNADAADRARDAILARADAVERGE